MEDNQLNTNSGTTGVANQTVPAAPQEQDISKATITILVLLTLMISVIGTWTVLNEVSNYQPQAKPSESTASVSLNVLNPNQVPTPQPSQNQNPKLSATGNAVLEIK